MHLAQTYPNPDHARFESPWRLANRRYQAFNASGSTLYLSEPESFSESLGVAVASLDGVVECSIDPYAVYVTKATCFSWEELTKPIIETVRLHVEAQQATKEM